MAHILEHLARSQSKWPGILILDHEIPETLITGWPLSGSNSWEAGDPPAEAGSFRKQSIDISWGIGRVMRGSILGGRGVEMDDLSIPLLPFQLCKWLRCVSRMKQHFNMGRQVASQGLCSE